MAKWGISKRGKRYYNLRDSDGQFTDDGIPNGSIPSLSNVAQARVANALRKNDGFRRPTSKDKTASTTRYRGAQYNDVSNRDSALAYQRQKQAGSAKAAKPATAGNESWTEKYAREQREGKDNGVAEFFKKVDAQYPDDGEDDEDQVNEPKKPETWTQKYAREVAEGKHKDVQDLFKKIDAMYPDNGEDDEDQENEPTKPETWTQKYAREVAEGKHKEIGEFFKRVDAEYPDNGEDNEDQETWIEKYEREKAERGGKPPKEVEELFKRIDAEYPDDPDADDDEDQNLPPRAKPEGKDARSMTAAEKLEAGRIMFGDKNPKVKEAELAATREQLARGARSLGPEARQRYLNDHASNGTALEQAAAKQMGGRDVNAPTKARSQHGLSPERQRLEAVRKGNAKDPVQAARERVAELEAIESPSREQSLALTAARNALAKEARRSPAKPGTPENARAGIDILTEGGNMPIYRQIDALERNMPTGGAAKRIFNEKLSELKEKQRRADNRRKGLNDDGSPDIPDVVGVLGDDPAPKPRRSGIGRERAKADAEVARLERLREDPMTPSQATAVNVELIQAKRAAQQLRIAEQNEQSDRAKGLPKRADNAPAGLPSDADPETLRTNREAMANRVGVKSRPAVDYGSDYASMPANQQKTYRSKRRKLIDTAVEAGLPATEIKRIFSGPMGSWPSAAELKKARRR